MDKIKTYLAIAGISILLLGLTNGVTAWKFYGMGEEARQAVWDKANKAATGKKLDVKVKQDAIDNSPADVDSLIAGMRDRVW